MSDSKIILPGQAEQASRELVDAANKFVHLVIRDYPRLAPSLANGFAACIVLPDGQTPVRMEFRAAANRNIILPGRG